MKRHNEQEKIEWFRLAQICAVIANCNRDPKKKPSPFKVEYFMPRKRQKPITGNDMLDRIRILNAAMGGKEKIKDG